MARSLPVDHQPYPVATADDMIALWRCDEATAATNFADAGPGGYTVAQAGNPTVQPSLFQSDASKGARRFDGATQWGLQAASPGIHTTLQGSWTVMAWVRLDAGWAADGTILEYGAYASPETAATNAQLRVGVLSTQRLFTAWEYGTGTVQSAVASAGTEVALDTVLHLAFVKEEDPDVHSKYRVRLYVNGDLIETIGNLTNATDGSSGKWIIGGSLDGGSGVSTPGILWTGDLDDVVVLPFAATHERVRETYARGVRDFSLSQLGSTGQYALETHVRVLVQDRNAITDGVDKVWDEYVDVSSIFNVDFLRGVEWSEGIDDQGARATITLMRQFYAANLSPFVIGTAGLAPSAESFNPLAGGIGYTGLYFLDARCRVKIETALVPLGTLRENVGPYWDLQFDGLIVSADVAGDEVHVTCVDRIAALQDVWAETDPSTGVDANYGSAPAGDPLEGVVQDVIDAMDPALFAIVNIDDSGPGGVLQILLFDPSAIGGLGRPHLFQAGDSILISGTTNYNGIWTVASTTYAQLTTVEASGGAFGPETSGSLLGPSSMSYWAGKPSVWCPTSPSFAMFPINVPATKNVAQVIDDFAAFIGWKTSFFWDENRGEFRLCLYNPAEATGTLSVSTTDMLVFERMATKIDDERNIGVIEYPNDSARDPVDERQRYVVTAKDTAQGRQYGRRYFRIGTGSQTLITSSSEAQAYIDQVVADLANPSAEASFTFRLMPHPLIGDVVRIVNATNDYQMPSALALDTPDASLVGVRHVYREGEIRTTLELRKFETSGTYSQPVGRIGRHFDRIHQAGLVGGKGLAPVQSVGTPQVDYLSSLHSVVVWWTSPAGDRNRAWDTTEVHISDSGATFTPSDSTLAGVVRGSQFVVRGLSVATTYYVRIVHRDRMLNRSAPSTAASFAT